MSFISIIAQQGGGGTVTGGGWTPPETPSYTKNFQKVENVSTYDAFGFPVRTGADRITIFYRSGTNHLVNGRIMGRHLTISTQTWGSAFEVYDDPDGLDMRDAWGGIMSNGEIVIFTCSSEYDGVGPSILSYAHMIRLNGTTMALIEVVDLFDNASLPQMQRGLPFGGMQAHSTTGTYSIAMWQYNGTAGTTDKPTFPLYRVDVLKTTDYWATFTVLNVYEGTQSISESVLAVFPDDNTKMSMFSRMDPGGFLYLRESTNGGSSWTNRGDVVELGLNGTKSKSPFAYINLDGTLDMAVGDRDTGWVMMSRNNRHEDYFGGNELNLPELVYFNRFGGMLVDDNYKLGYPSMLEVSAGQYFFMFAKQESASKANLWWTFWDIDTDPDGVPAAPPEIMATADLVGATSALVYCKMDDEGGYTLDQLENIRWFEWSLSTDNFATFTTARIIYSSGEQSFFGVINGIRVPSHQLNIYELTTATTYKVRARACNNAGNSAWTVKEFTTD